MKFERKLEMKKIRNMLLAEKKICRGAKSK